MKRIVACALLLALVFQVFAVNVFAEAPNSTTITANFEYDKDASNNLDNNGNVHITINTPKDVDLMIKVLDTTKNDKTLYLEILSAEKNNGTYVLTLKKEDLGFNKKLLLVVSAGTDALEQEFEIEYYQPQVYPDSNGDSTTTTEDVKPWDKTIGSTEVGKGQGLAYIDPMNEAIVQAAGAQPSAWAAADFIEKTTAATSAEALTWESTKNTIAVSVETMIASLGTKRISANEQKNQLILNASSVSADELKKYTENEKTLLNAVKKNKISLNRGLTKEYIVKTAFSTTQKANITIYKSFIQKLENVGIETLTISDAKFRVSYSLTELNAMIGDQEFTSFDLDTTALSGGSKKLTVNFDTDHTQSVKISFPGLSANSQYMAIVDENGNPVGGRYNPATGEIEAKISASGVYQVVNNEKDFEDIKHLSDEMQKSIKILAAKGIIEGTSERHFSPEDSISRAEVAALLLRVLSQVDPNADGGFADVKKADWFYGTAGSAKAYGMIVGFADNTFRGNETIAKDQILTISSRILQKEMKYIVPTDPHTWLTFQDAHTIADWARNDIALTSMANIITRSADNTIRAGELMTRGDAALVIMRLFYKIW